MDNLPYMWHKGEDYQKGSRGSKPFSVPLIFRIATVEDRKGVTPAKRSRYLWMKRVGPPRTDFALALISSACSQSTT